MSPDPSYQNQCVGFGKKSFGRECIFHDDRTEARRIDKTESTAKNFRRQLDFGSLNTLNVARIALLRNVLRQRFYRYFVIENPAVVFQYNPLFAAIAHGGDHRRERNDTSRQSVGPEDCIHQGGFPAIEAAENNKIEPILRKPGK